MLATLEEVTEIDAGGRASEPAGVGLVPALPSVAPAPAPARLSRRYVLRQQDPARAEELARTCGVSPVIAQVLLNRGLFEGAEAQAFLQPKLANLTQPDGMLDRARAAERLADAVDRREQIVVFGDYDVDGTTSTAILADVLEALGGRVQALVANRFEGGYGLSDRALDRILALSPRVLVTCDCGSSDGPRVARARAAGVDVIVVDHHLVPPDPLEAVAFLNPHRPECGFPFKGLCSAGLALSLSAAVRARLKSNLDLRQWLDLVALGTIADIAPLHTDNRALVRVGLDRLASDQARPGVMALREAAKIRTGTHVSGIDVAFRLAPRLNAAGRLGDPAVTLALLRAKTLEEARGLALQIERLNNERKELERQVTAAAIEQVDLDAHERHGIVAAGQGWHRGVVGISAARLVERYQRPTLVIGLDGEFGHGSGRAPDGFPLYAAIARSRELLEKFGGHDAAAGLTIRADRVELLRAQFESACAELATQRIEVEEIAVDARIDGEGYRLPVAPELVLLEPLGECNPEPVFEARGEVVRADEVGEGHLKLTLRIGARELPAFGYELAARRPALATRVRAFGHLRPDTYRGGQCVELRLLDLELETP
ncbi:MAG: single-stranded-DNA-specific exonuclease RecJ [Myxococcales bacterium]